MNGAMPEPVPDFETLRARGIALAQTHSGEIWTDYNVHDPGITILEQFSFALTEYGYRAGFPVADLLARVDGALDLAHLGLATPREVLAVRPVTPGDIARAIAGAEPSISRAIVEPRSGEQAGLYDIHVVPDTDAAPEVALAAARSRYHTIRNLGEDAATIGLATRIPCRLDARIEIRRRHAPERVAALVYAQCRRLMRDRRANKLAPPATRQDAFDEPAVMFGHSADSAGGASALDQFFADLISLDEIEDIISLRFTRIETPGEDAFAPLTPGSYRELVLPQTTEEVGLELVSRDLPVPFDLERMRLELARLRADYVARLSETLDPEDWSYRPEGRRRNFSYLPLGTGLPPAYGVGPGGPALGSAPADRARAAQLRGYLAITDAMLNDATEDLSHLGDLMSTDLTSRESYRAHPMATEAHDALRAESRNATRSRLASFDPWHARKGRALDRLLALQCEEMSQNTLRQHDVYRPPAARRDAVLENRVRLLRAAAALNRDRAGGANVQDGAPGRLAPLCRKLCLLLDFQDRVSGPLSAPLSRLGLRLTSEDDDVEGGIPRDLLPAPENPFDTLVPRHEPEPNFDRQALIERTDFLRERKIPIDLLRRAITPEAYLLAPEADGAWRLFLDPGNADDLLTIGRFENRRDAIEDANRLRVMFIDLNRKSEGVHVIEDVLLRGSGSEFRPRALSFVLPNWTKRTEQPSFQRLTEETIRLISPAHLRHKVFWLDLAQMQEFEALELAWRVALRDHARGGGPWADDLDHASEALRAFLEKRGKT
ncbi:MAG: hypothetical protein AAGG56_15970 [Pseudomonadota bacterium]